MANGASFSYMVPLLLLASLACLSLVTATPPPNSPEQLEQIQREIDLTPPAEDFSRFFEALPALPRRLRIASPCCGIHGTSHALKILNTEADSVLTYDLDASYRYYLEKTLRDTARMSVCDILLHLGKVAGDLLRLPTNTLQVQVDLLAAGPPCPPWAGQGKRASLDDPRALVFMRLLVWIYILVHTGGLLGVILENVPGILAKNKGGLCVMDIFLTVLHKWIPEFSWRVDKLELVRYRCAQSRVRVFLRGMRKLVCSVVPAPLPPFGSRSIRDSLARGAPPTPRTELTPEQQHNLLVAINPPLEIPRAYFL